MGFRAEGFGVGLGGVEGVFGEEGVELLGNSEQNKGAQHVRPYISLQRI